MRSPWVLTCGTRARGAEAPGAERSACGGRNGPKKVVCRRLTILERPFIIVMTIQIVRRYSEEAAGRATVTKRTTRPATEEGTAWKADAFGFNPAT